MSTSTSTATSTFLTRPFRALSSLSSFPRALPWANMTRPVGTNTTRPNRPVGTKPTRLARTLALHTGMALLLPSAFCLLPSFSPLRANPPVADYIDASIERGLRFLAEGQILTGHAREVGNFESGPSRNIPGIAALAGMAFLAKGYLPGEGEYGETLNRCIDAVLAAADANGYMGGNGGRMYSHAMCTLFLSEVSHMMKDTDRQERLEKVLPNATKIIVDAQQKPQKDGNNKGGWRYEPTSGDSDLSCSGWNLMALRSARLKGAPVPVKCIEDAVGYLLRRHNEQSGTFGYQDNSSYATTLSGAAILGLALCGQHNNPAIARGVRFLMTVYDRLPNETRCFYGMYYTAQGIFQYGGEEWQKFSTWMYDYWIPRQTHEGKWDRGEEGCPYYQTAMVVLSFTVPYRQLPIYTRDETVDQE